jgi:AN1-type zinc finger protein 5/6
MSPAASPVASSPSPAMEQMQQEQQVQQEQAAQVQQGEQQAAAAAAAGEPAEKPQKKRVQKDKSKCFACRRRVGHLGFECKCEYVFCSQVRILFVASQAETSC